MPLRPFFAATGTLLYLMAFVFTGQGLRELQNGGAIGDTRLVGAPHVDLLGMYPSVETLAGQGVLVALFALACWVTFVTPRLRSRQDQRKSPGA
jgi:high-affinity iron transporter